MGVDKIAFPCFYIFAFCSLTDRSTGKIFIEQMLIYERNVQRKKQPFISIWGRENRISIFLHFYFLQPDRETDRQYLQNRCIYMRGICTEKNYNSISIRERQLRFRLNLTDGSNYKVASLLKTRDVLESIRSKICRFLT